MKLKSLLIAFTILASTTSWAGVGHNPKDCPYSNNKDLLAKTAKPVSEKNPDGSDKGKAEGVITQQGS